jgi:hypothetical protein
MWVHIMGKIDFSQHDLCFRSWSCYLYQTHLFSSKGRVQLHGGAANWWSCCSRIGLVEPEAFQTRPYIGCAGTALRVMNISDLHAREYVSRCFFFQRKQETNRSAFCSFIPGSTIITKHGYHELVWLVYPWLISPSCIIFFLTTN